MRHASSNPWFPSGAKMLFRREADRTESHETKSRCKTPASAIFSSVFVTTRYCSVSVRSLFIHPIDPFIRRLTIKINIINVPFNLRIRYQISNLIRICCIHLFIYLGKYSLNGEDNHEVERLGILYPVGSRISILPRRTYSEERTYKLLMHPIPWKVQKLLTARKRNYSGRITGRYIFIRDLGCIELASFLLEKSPSSTNVSPLALHCSLRNR